MNSNHREDLGLVGQACADRLKLVLTNFIVAEVYATLLCRMGSRGAGQWRAIWHSQIPVLRVSVGDGERAKEIPLKYSDKDFSYMDAASFAVFSTPSEALLEAVTVPTCAEDVPAMHHSVLIKAAVMLGSARRRAEEHFCLIGSGYQRTAGSRA